MLRECPMCGYQQDSFSDVFACQGCGAELDFTPYISEEFLKKEGSVIPESKSGASFNPWLFGKNSDVTPEKGLRVTITSEWCTSTNAKIKAFLFGNCEYDGKDYTVGINETTWREISKVYGNDTRDWVNKKIEYQGKVPMGSRGATGHLWTAVK